MNRIERLAHGIKLLLLFSAYGLAISLPLTVLAVAALPADFLVPVARGLSTTLELTSVSAEFPWSFEGWGRFVLIAGLVPRLAVFLLAALLLYELCSLYESGRYLTEKNVRLLFYLSLVLLGSSALEAVYETWLLYWLGTDFDRNPIYHHVLADCRNRFVAGLVLLLITYIMKEGQRLKDEHDQTI